MVALCQSTFEFGKCEHAPSVGATHWTLGDTDFSLVELARGIS